MARDRRFACSLLDVAQLAIPAFFILAFTYTIADADLWGHLRFGADLMRGGGFTRLDPYSFTSDTPWINHEWLAEIVTALFYGAAGGFGLNVLKLSVIGAIGAIVWRTARKDGGSRFALVVITGLVLFASYTRTQVLRPQLFSVLYFAVLMALLRRHEQDARVPPLALPALFCLWANTHGGWLVGFGTLAAWSVAIVIERRRLAFARRRAIDALAALAATLVTPYGVDLWRFLQQTVGLERDISDWTPFMKFPAALMAIELALPAVAAVAYWRRREWPPARHAVVFLMLAFATYRVGRVDAFLQVAIGMLAMPALVALFNGVERALSAQPRFTHRSPVHAYAAAGLFAYACGVGAGQVGRIHIAGPWIPDEVALKYIQRESANTRLLTWFDWGEYAIWHLSPIGIQVSMDGRRETVYSERVLQDHWTFYRNEKPDAWTYPTTIGADRIWLPKRFPIVPILQERGWHVAFESDVSVVLSHDTPPAVPEILMARGARVFPGP